MKAWRGTPEEAADEDHAATEAAITAAGIELDPTPPGQHRHGDVVASDGHTHPHQHSAAGEPPLIGIVGGGAVETALGVALTRAGWPVHAVASRDPAGVTRSGPPSRVRAGSPSRRPSSRRS